MENLDQSTSHPRGLYVLFFTEMWERFGYYLMLGIFSLYMIDSIQNGGMGFSDSKKSDIYGTYLGLVYLTPFIGGLLADRILGYRRSIIIGELSQSSRAGTRRPRPCCVTCSAGCRAAAGSGCR